MFYFCECFSFSLFFQSFSAWNLVLGFGFFTSKNFSAQCGQMPWVVLPAVAMFVWRVPIGFLHQAQERNMIGDIVSICVIWLCRLVTPRRCG